MRTHIRSAKDHLVVLLHLQRLRIRRSTLRKCQRLTLQHPHRIRLRVERVQSVLQQLRLPARQVHKNQLVLLRVMHVDVGHAALHAQFQLLGG